MGSERLPINGSQKTGQKAEEKISVLRRRKAEEETKNAGGNKFDVVYKGRYAVVADYGYRVLVAHASEEPKQKKKEYLLRMVDELLAVRDKVLKGDKYMAIHISAKLRRGGVWYSLGIMEDGDVPIVPQKYDYEEFIRTADKVEMYAVGKEANYIPGSRSWRYAFVVEDEKGSLHAFGRKDAGLESGELMLAVIKDVMDNFEDLRRWRNVEAVDVRGWVWRNNVKFYPVVYRDRKVNFVWRSGDYVDFVRRAEGVEFV